KFAQVMYFKSEKEAREAEANPQNEGPPEEWSSLFTNVSYTDISDPQLI
ncbi:MAG: hypothetical protein QOH90_432, partial [Actinomycetota bacterium]|nr:hypothetical protein [Actinomycetota bacterium]